MFHIHVMPVGSYACNCSIVSCDETKEAIVVDPGGDGDRIISHIQEKGFKVKHILHTHAHLDHIGATADVKKACCGSVVIHKEDMYLYDHADEQAKRMGIKYSTPPMVDHYLKDDDEYSFGNWNIKAIHTPGHTPGSASFLLSSDRGQVLFAGDTLFRRSIGRTDLPGGDSKLIAKSIKERLFSLDGDTFVVTGHGPSSTIGEEIYENPFVGKHA